MGAVIDRRGRRAVEPQLAQGVVQHQHRPDAGRRRRDGGLVLGGQDMAGRILVRPDQIDQPGPDAGDGGQHPVHVPALGRHGHGRQVEAGLHQGVEGVGIAGVLDHYSVAGPRRRPQQQCQATEGAGADDDLFRSGRQTVGGVALGHGATQGLDPHRLIAPAGQVGGQGLQGAGIGGVDLFVGGHGGRGHVDDPRRVLPLHRSVQPHRARGRAGGQGGEAARTRPADHEAVGPQPVQRRADGDAADAQGLGQTPLAGQARVQRQSPVQDHQLQRLGQAAIGGLAVRPAPAVQLTRQGGGVDQGVAHKGLLRLRASPNSTAVILGLDPRMTAGGKAEEGGALRG
ncbi:hypothetical protein D3C80_890450 [compost metagenome]